MRTPSMPRLRLCQLWKRNEAHLVSRPTTPGNSFCFLHARDAARAVRAMRAPIGRHLSLSGFSISRTCKVQASRTSFPHSRPLVSLAKSSHSTPSILLSTMALHIPSPNTQFSLYIPASLSSDHENDMRIDHVLLAVNTPRAQLTVSSTYLVVRSVALCAN